MSEGVLVLAERNRSTQTIPIPVTCIAAFASAILPCAMRGETLTGTPHAPLVHGSADTNAEDSKKKEFITPVKIDR